MSKVRKLTTPKFGIDVQKLQLLSTSGGVQNGATTLEYNVAALNRVENTSIL